jgi:putative 4-mercaptohistidine N1-methyltranferase
MISAKAHIDDIYETDRSLGEYLLFHYGSNKEQFPWDSGPNEALNFATRSVLELIDIDSTINSALDIGCAVGKSSFVLANFSKKVLGLDYSSSFINAANRILKTGELKFKYHEEGSRWIETSIVMDTIPNNLTFDIGDACNLPEDLGSFQLVHAANLLCRLPKPLDFLERISEIISPGGQLILTTPFTWLEEFTATQDWLEDGDSATALKNILIQNFDLELEKDLPFLIREHRRKFQYSIALGMRWRRKSET